MKNIFTLIGLLATLPTLAQYNTDSTRLLDDVTVMGSRLQIPFSQATRDIQIISAAEIEQLPVHSLNEVLAYVSGVDIRQRGPFGAQADIAIDGGSSEQTLVLLNGVKLLDAQSAHNMMNIPVPLSAIDHIEVLRGAAARVYGINALTGAINIVTKKLDHGSLTVDLQSGSSFKHKASGDGTGIYAGGGAAITGSIGNRKTNHLIAAGYDNYNGQRYNSGAKNTKLFYTGQYKLDSNNIVEGMAGYARSHYGANGFYAAPADINSAEIAHSSIFSLASHHHLGRFTLSPRISDRYGEDDYRFYKDDLSKARSLHYTNALMLELSSSLKTKIGTIGFGWESRFEKINSSNIGRHERSNHGAYAEFQSAIGQKLETTLGLYTNYYTSYNWQVYPGIDLAYHLSPCLQLSASVGSGARIPSFSDLYLNQLPGNIGNKDVQPEDAWHYEFNIEYHKSSLRAKAGYFYRNINDFIDWVRTDENSPYSPINFGENKVSGVYTRINQHIRLGSRQALDYSLSYNYLNPKIGHHSDLQSKYILESLKHQFISTVGYTLHQFSFQLSNRWIKRELAKSYDVADARLNYQFANFRLSASVNNIFDASYIEAGAVPMPTRWFSLGLQFKWH